jgi:hypothetical protein
MDALIVAGVSLLALWVVVVIGRKRAERRADEARSRAQARRVRVPVVSSNLRGQSMAPPDLWHESAGAAERGGPPQVAAPHGDR